MPSIHLTRKIKKKGKETRKGKHKCRSITKFKDKPEEGTITFLTIA